MKCNDEQGQSLIEFSLLVPFLFLLIINVVNFGAFLYASITVANAARAGADYLMMGPASILGSLPTYSQVNSLVTADLSSLPNQGTATVTICTNNNGQIQNPPGTCLASVPDPQASTSVVGQVNVTYLYTPLIRFWDFPNLKIHLTLPPTTIHRAATTRLIQ